MKTTDFCGVSDAIDCISDDVYEAISATKNEDIGCSLLKINSAINHAAYVLSRLKAIRDLATKSGTAESRIIESYTTQPGESVMGIAQRQLGDERRWGEIKFLNADRFPNIAPHSYYPVGTVLKMPPKEGWNSTTK